MKIKVKHLVEYLSKLDGDMDVKLSHDGWMIQDNNPVDELDAIKKRDIFSAYQWDDGPAYLVINN